MDIFSDENMQVFSTALKNIHDVQSGILTVFGNDLHEYINRTDNPYNISVPMQDVLEFVDANYMEIAGQVEKIFRSAVSLKNYIDNFVSYYTLLEKTLSKPVESNKDKTIVIALVLILISRNVNTTVAKKVHVILKSMCVQPTVGVLVQVSQNVINDI